MSLWNRKQLLLGKRCLQQMAASRRFPIQHLAQREQAGQAAQHESSTQLPQRDSASRQDGTLNQPSAHQPERQRLLQHPLAPKRVRWSEGAEPTWTPCHERRPHPRPNQSQAPLRRSPAEGSPVRALRRHLRLAQGPQARACLRLVPRCDEAGQPDPGHAEALSLPTTTARRGPCPAGAPAQPPPAPRRRPC